MAKILFNALQASPNGAGISRYCICLGRELGKNRWDGLEVTLLVRRSAANLFPPECRLVVVDDDLGSSWKRNLFEQLRLPRLVHEGGFDLVHIPDSVGPWRLGTPYVLTIHDVFFFTHPETFTRQQRIWKKWMTRHSLRGAAGLIAVSNYTAGEVAALGLTSKDSMRVIWNGFEPPDVGQDDINPFRDWILMDKRVPFVLFVGTIEPRKNLVRLIRAFDQIKRSFSIPHKLVIVGKKGWLSDPVFHVVMDLGLQNEVLFTGRVSEDALRWLYLNAEVFACVSLAEGFGLPVLEAFAAGVPVLASATGSLPEVAGDAAVFTDPMDEGAIAEGLMRIIRDEVLRGELAQRGRERLALFSWEKAADDVVDYYREVLQGCRRTVALA